MTREALPADRRQFLQHDEDVYLGNGVTANIRVFASEEMVRNMANHSDELDGIRNAFCDATFNSAPAGYLQYFTVHMKINNRLYPALVQVNTYFIAEWGNDTLRWNIFHLLSHRTNNDVEGFQWKVNNYVGKAKNFFKFIRFVQDENDLAEKNIKKWLRGQPLEIPRDKYYEKRNNDIVRMRGKYVGGTLSARIYHENLINYTASN